MTDTADKHDPSPLDEFSSRLEAAKKAADPNAENTTRGRAMGKGFRLASELLAAMIVGPLLGLGIDRLAGSSPWGLLLGILLGFIAGVRNVAVAMKEDGAGGDASAD
jgi:ATP synthase protein I